MQLRKVGSNNVPRTLLMGRVPEGKQIAHSNRVYVVLLQEVADLGPHFRLVEWHDNGALGVDAFGNIHPQAPGSQEGWRLRVHKQVVHTGTFLPTDFQHVLKTCGHQEADTGSLLL